jgi:hypothetical protein
MLCLIFGVRWRIGAQRALILAHACEQRIEGRSRYYTRDQTARLTPWVIADTGDRLEAGSERGRASAPRVDGLKARCAHEA